MAKFWVPGFDTADAEQAYLDLALWSGGTPSSERIESIEFSHDGQEWRACVGEELWGSETRSRRHKGKIVETTRRLQDAARVVAILPGQPYKIVTSARPIGDDPSAWANPFYVGQPRRIKHFDSSERVPGVQNVATEDHSHA